MRELENILLITFVIFGSILIIKSYYPILEKIFQKNKSKQSGTNIEQELDILSSSLDSAKKASAFVALMNLSYVLVHTFISTKNYYNDEIQQRKFKQSLTPELIAKLNALN